MEKLIVILAAAGLGQRLGLGMNKAFVLLEGAPVIAHNLFQINQVPQVENVIVVVRPNELEEGTVLLKKYQAEYYPGLSWQIVAGGKERQDSVANALQVIEGDDGYVAVHDGARPFATPSVFARVLAAAKKTGAAVAGVAVKDTTKIVDKNEIVVETLERSKLRAVQTPQIFQLDLLKKAYAVLQAEGREVTDDAGAVENLGAEVVIAEGSYSNNKITTPEDLIWAGAFLRSEKERSMSDNMTFPIRVGSGFDVHRLVAERKLILCGVEIPYELGLEGHSDADVALHALMDALLGAVGMGDIGKHFPDTDIAYKGADSMLLFKHVAGLLTEQGWQVGNVDVTIIAQKPKLAAYRGRMEENIARVLKLGADAINVKATTTEGLGFAGRGEGIAAQAVVTVHKIKATF